MRNSNQGWSTGCAGRGTRPLARIANCLHGPQMSQALSYCTLLQCKGVAAIILGLLLALSDANTCSAGPWAGAISGMAEALNQQAQEAQRQQQQKELMDYQYKLEMERLERAAQLESQRIERQNQLERERLEQQRAEEARRQQAIRQQQQLADEKKQQEAAEQKRNATVTGTGFFVAPGGYLVTNHHVVEDTTTYAVRDFKGRFYRATVVASDPKRDLALLKVDGAFPTLKIISSDSVSKGQRVLAVGYPQISIQGNESKVTDGIISSFTGVRNDENWFQISVPIQGGNSGGPLVTESGGVVGVVVATANVARFYKMTGNLPQNVNYAIKSKVLLEFLSAQNLQNISTAKGKVSVEAVDTSTVMVIAKNGPIDVAYTASPEQVAREERERAMAVANEAKRQREEALAEQRRLAEERRLEKQRSEETALMSKRDQAILKAYPDWQETKDSNIFVAWLAEQKKETTDKLNSAKAAEVISIIKQYHAELPRFANRYASLAQRPQATSTTPVNSRWVRVNDTTEVLSESIVRSGQLVRYTYRERRYSASPEPPISAAADCGTRQRSDVQRDGSMDLKTVYPGTRQSAELELVCQLDHQATQRLPATESSSAAKPSTVPSAGQIIKDCEVCPELVAIPAGTFLSRTSRNHTGNAISRLCARFLDVQPIYVLANVLG